MKINIIEVLILTVLFAALAIYTDIFNDHHVMGFITNHIIALALALVVARVFFHFKR